MPHPRRRLRWQDCVHSAKDRVRSAGKHGSIDVHNSLRPHMRTQARSGRTLCLTSFTLDQLCSSFLKKSASGRSFLFPVQQKEKRLAAEHTKISRKGPLIKIASPLPAYI